MATTLTEALTKLILDATGATSIGRTRHLQTLWSGYGEIVRCELEGGTCGSVIAKHVRWPTDQQHPRGWNSNRSHARKVRSYEVETAWYERYAPRCSDAARVAHCLAADQFDDGVALILEDLDAAGYERRCRSVGQRELMAGLSWLADFHATFLGEAPEGLWETGTYWHLATRPDELEVMADGPLKDKAAAIDAKLNQCHFQTIVHGDAKLANFCFSADQTRVAAVDFQYVGGGCGIKDVAYFLSSCLDEDAMEQQAPGLLNAYFERLEAAMSAHDKAQQFPALHEEWRALYPVAWADFTRFLLGWSPGHWKVHRYSRGLTDQVVAAL